MKFERPTGVISHLFSGSPSPLKKWLRCLLGLDNLLSKQYFLDHMTARPTETVVGVEILAFNTAITIQKSSPLISQLSNSQLTQEKKNQRLYAKFMNI